MQAPISAAVRPTRRLQIFVPARYRRRWASRRARPQAGARPSRCHWTLRTPRRARTDTPAGGKPKGFPVTLPPSADNQDRQRSTRHGAESPRRLRTSRSRSADDGIVRRAGTGRIGDAWSVEAQAAHYHAWEIQVCTRPWEVDFAGLGTWSWTVLRPLGRRVMSGGQVAHRVGFNYCKAL